MTKKEALQILCFGTNQEACTLAENNGYKVLIYPEDVQRNLENNDYEINLDFIQDFITEDGQLYQGHSLGELKII